MKLFLECDLSRIESRIVGALTLDPELIRRARTLPDEFDEYKCCASIIFGLPEDRITYEQRQLGKRVVLATNYGMGPKRFAEILLNDDYIREIHPRGISVAECAKWMGAYLRATPAIEAWQQRTRLYLLEQKRDIGTMKLRTSWGREIDYTYERLDERLWKRAYAFIPQSEDGDLMNQWGVLALWKYLQARPLEGVAMNIQEHDAIILSTPVEHAYEVASFLQDSLTRPRKYKLEALCEGVELSIPVEFSLMLDWGKEHRVSFKRLPNQEKLERQAEQLLRSMK